MLVGGTAAAMRKYETTGEGTCLRHVTEEFFEACRAEHKALGGRHRSRSATSSVSIPLNIMQLREGVSSFPA